MSVRASSSEPVPTTLAKLREALLPMADLGDLLPSIELLDWVLPLPNGGAPGFVYLAGAFRSGAVGGGGRDLASAAGRLAGEAAETIAQWVPPRLIEGPADPGIDAIWGTGPRVAAVNLTRGVGVAVPAAAIHLEAERGEAAPPRSLGLGAGRDVAAARLSGLLELIERDAAAAWWIDGAVPRALDAGAIVEATKALAEMRRGAGAPRPTGFLELPSETGVPVVCAFSRDAEGSGLALGLKAHLSVAAAAQGALMELMQMELALDIARIRQSQGRPSAGDTGPLGRAALDPDRFAAFTARPPGIDRRPLIAGFEDLVAHLATLGHEVTVADLDSLPGGLKVAKVFVPSLRPMPGDRAVPIAEAPGAMAELM